MPDNLKSFYKCAHAPGHSLLIVIPKNLLTHLPFLVLCKPNIGPDCMGELYSTFSVQSQEVISPFIDSNDIVIDKNSAINKYKKTFFFLVLC